MKNKLIPLILIGFVLFNFSNAVAQEQDTFQQVMNYLVTGDPYQRSTSEINRFVFTLNYPVVTATIFDRQKCIAGYRLDYNNDKEDVMVRKIYWNNVDINSIAVNLSNSTAVSIHYNHPRPYLEISGAKMVAFEEHYQYGRLVDTASYKSYQVNVGDGKKRDFSRLQNALRLLFREHCSGMQSAF